MNTTSWAKHYTIPIQALLKLLHFQHITFFFFFLHCYCLWVCLLQFQSQLARFAHKNLHLIQVWACKILVIVRKIPFEQHCVTLNSKKWKYKLVSALIGTNESVTLIEINVSTLLRMMELLTMATKQAASTDKSESCTTDLHTSVIRRQARCFL